MVADDHLGDHGAQAGVDGIVQVVVDRGGLQIVMGTVWWSSRYATCGSVLTTVENPASRDG
ncbi:hypothetical protein H7K09_24575 [Mycolicibacterium duvalii]|nr:hypothetical protein [Mycolicibacterium duvalii]